MYSNISVESTGCCIWTYLCGILFKIAGRSAEVAHLSWAQGVAGSNPVAPTKGTDLIEKIIEFAREKMSSDPSHGFDHVIRVVRFCDIIGKAENADMEILIPAAYLHDIARAIEDQNPTIDHAKEGSKIASGFLIDLGYPKVKEIAYAIEVHRFSTGIIPETLEAKILQDADRLDAIGAMGIYRTIVYSVSNDIGFDGMIEHFEKKILKLKDLMYTETAKHIALKRHELVLNFVQSLREADTAPF